MSSAASAVKRPKRDKHLTQDPKRLRLLRIAAGLRGIDLAARTGYTKQHISGLEKGDSSASPECLVALAEALGCQVTDLMPKLPAPISAQQADEFWAAISAARARTAECQGVAS